MTSVTARAERGKALGITVAATYLGLSLGPIVGGFLTHELGWRRIFFCTAPLGALAGALVVARLEGDWAGAKGEPFDAPGALLYGVSLASLMYGFARLPASGAGLLIAAGAAGIGAFAFWETRARAPLIRVSVADLSRPWKSMA